MDAIIEFISGTFGIIVMIGGALVVIYIIIGAISSSTRSLVESKDRRAALAKSQIKQEFEDLKEKNDSLEHTREELTKERNELKEKLSYLNQQKFKDQLDTLHEVYYDLLLKYIDDPKLRAEDFFPTDKDTISVLYLQTKLNKADDRIYFLNREIGKLRRNCIEQENENKALKFEYDELLGENIELKKENEKLKRYDWLYEVEEYENLKEENKKLKKDSVNAGSGTQHISSPDFKAFYDTPEGIENLYINVDPERLCRVLDPTLKIKNDKFEVFHTNVDNTLDGSESKPYIVTFVECSCPDFKYNKGASPCKHMLFLAYNFGILRADVDADLKYTKSNSSKKSKSNDK